MYRLLRLAIVICFVNTGFVHALSGESVFMKALGGLGYSIMSETVPDTTPITISITGPGGFATLQAGGSFSKELKIFALASVFYSPFLSSKVENLTVTTVYNSNSIIDFGLGVAYYLREGYYASLGASLATNYLRYTVYEYNLATYTRHGWGLHLNIGKEFNFAKRASYGVSVVAYYGRVSDVGQAPFLNTPITNLYFGLAGSVTYD